MDESNQLTFEEFRHWINVIEKNINKPQKEGNMNADYNDSDIRVQAVEHQEVVIKKANNGWIIKVGCTTFVETDWNKICKALKEYWDDPVKAEKKYYKK